MESFTSGGVGGLSNAPLASSAPGSLTQVAPAPNSHPVLEEPDEAGSLRIALHKLSPAQQSQIRREVAAASPRKAKLKVMPRGKPAREVTASEAPAPHPAIRVGEQGAAATEKAARDAAMIRELCKANGGFI